MIVGYSTPRDMTSAAVTFTPAPGVTLAGSSVTVSLSQVFTTWYASAPSAQFGSAFSLQIPFTMPAGANPLLSLSVVLSNSQVIPLRPPLPFKVRLRRGPEVTGR